MSALSLDPAVGAHSAGSARLAAGIRRELARRRRDFAPVATLARTLRATPDAVRAAAAGERCLGLCGTAVFCLPPQPLAMGFRAELRNQRLMLRLPARHRPDLWISGHRLGPMPPGEPDGAAPFGRGELAHTITRLSLMARSWLHPGIDPTRELFELIATAWLLGHRPKCVGTLGVLRVDFNTPIAREHGRLTSHLELIVNLTQGAHQLVNVFPFWVSDRSTPNGA